MRQHQHACGSTYTNWHMFTQQTLLGLFLWVQPTTSRQRDVRRTKEAEILAAVFEGHVRNSDSMHAQTSRGLIYWYSLQEHSSSCKTGVGTVQAAPTWFIAALASCFSASLSSPRQLLRVEPNTNKTAICRKENHKHQQLYQGTPCLQKSRHHACAILRPPAESSIGQLAGTKPHHVRVTIWQYRTQI
jgi:hypothetical protein